MANTAIEIVQQALEHAGEDSQQKEMLERLECRRITADKELPRMEFLFQMFGKPCFPRGELVGISGKPKSGKTFITSILIALCQCEQLLSIKRLSAEPLRVLWYDTEQSDESTQDILKNRIMRLIKEDETGPSKSPCLGGLSEADGDKSNNAIMQVDKEAPLHVFNVRQEAWKDRLPLLETAILFYKPDFVILDGIRDLVNDINDGVLAQDTVERLMHLATQGRCCIACILHQNKSVEDKNLRGWIGTELTHKSFEVYDCEKGTDRIFTFKQSLTRKYDIQETLRYIVNDDGIPELYSQEQAWQGVAQKTDPYTGKAIYNKAYITEWKDKKPVFNLPLLFGDAMPDEGVMYAAKEVQEKAMNLANITAIFVYNRQLGQAINDGVIIKTANEFGHVAYYRPKTKPVETQDATETDTAEGDIPF